MDCFVYVLGTRSKNRHLTYVGWTNDVARRLKQHNSGKGARTTRGRVWVLLHSEWFSTRARSHEPRVAPQARPRVPQKTGAEAEKRKRPMSIFKEPKIDCHAHVFDPVDFPYGKDIEYKPSGQEIGTPAQLAPGHEDLWRQPCAAGAAEFRLRQRQFLHARYHRARQRALQRRRHHRLRRRPCSLARLASAGHCRRGVQSDLPRHRLLQEVRRPDRTGWPSSTCSCRSRASTTSFDVRALDRGHAGARADRSLRTADAGGGVEAARLSGAAADRRTAA